MRSGHHFWIKLIFQACMERMLDFLAVRHHWVVPNLKLTNKTLRLPAFVGFATFFLLCHSVQAVSVLITVDNTGANDPVSIDTPRVWNFAVNSGYSLTVERGSFGLKSGSKTSEDITFSVWSGLGGNLAGNNLLGSSNLTSAEVDGFYSTLENFDITALVLQAGYYSVTLTTNAVNASTDNYFLKNGSAILQLNDGSGTILGSEYWTQDANNDGTATDTFNGAIPEPGMAVLMTFGCALLTLLRHKRD